ncbi:MULTISPECIES: transporter [Haloferax]|uniref:Transporter n=1 Tax=Haloferax marinum TaxID=2666143 RepID=A0A6A8GAB6_9EURY|nr:MULTISPECIES: transporter [Haloferax]KAB1198431.1 transporter [Haloferax sp. CBA1150]MRW97532.1 transporter [Haloferax marinum]
MSAATESVSESTKTRLRTTGVGAVSGLGAALLGYLATYIATSGTIENSTASQLLEALGSGLPTWKVVGWVFLNTHGVVTTFPGIFGTTSSANLVEQFEAFSTLLYAVPAVALVGAGAAVAVARGASTVKSGAIAGATTVAGYLPVAVAGVALFAVTIGDAVARPDPLTATLLAGVVYPLALGTVGGAVTAALR